MVAGAFGGVYGREHLCVQSMDGFVTLVEQDRLVGMRQLSKFLLPGPLAYCTKAEAAGGEKCPQASCPTGPIAFLLHLCTLVLEDANGIL